LFSWLFGLLFAIVIGVVWGVAVGISPLIGASSRIVIRLLRPVPSVALIPVAILALGTGMNMVLALVMFASIWPILFNTLYAVREIPEQYYDVARTLGLTRTESLITVTGVAMLPGLLTGIRVASGIALVVAVSAELVTGSSGLGGHILDMRTAGRLADAYASVLMGGVLGVVLNTAVVWMQRFFLAWSPDNRKAEG
jgi:ABC-type nitrate/sulfonate/bicarbonate transport system permease component